MRRRWLRIIRWTGIGTAVVGIVAALLLLSGYAFIQSEAGRARLVELLNRHLSTPGAVQVRIGRLEGDLPGRIELHDLSIDDADGTWLRLKFLGASWRPAALLAGTLSISNLDGRGLSVLRRPEDTESTGEFHWPELPLGISVQNFSLREAEIAQPLFGEAVAFRASGDTAIEGSDRVRTTIVVTRTDTVSGQAQLRMLLKPRSKYLEFQLALNEADGGVLARALDLDGLPSLSFQADGKGPVSALRGNARLRAGDLAFIESSFTVDVTNGPSLELAGRARIARLVDPPLRELLSSELAFEVQGTLTEDGIRLRRGSLANALARMNLSGELRGFAADFDVTVAVDDLKPLSDIARIPLQGQASVHSSIRSEDIRRTVTASSTASFTEVLPPSNPLQALVGSEIAVAGTFEFDAGRHWAVRDLTVSGSSALLNANATLSTDAARLEGDYQFTLSDLAALSAVLDTPIAGTLTANGNLGGSLDHPTLTAHMASPDLAVDAIVIGATQSRINIMQLLNGVRGDADLSVDNERIGALISTSRFAVDAGNTTLRLDGLTVGSRDTTLEGSMVVNLSDTTVTGKLSGTALSLAPWSELAGHGLSGRAGVALDLSSSGKSQRLDLVLNVDELNVALAPQRSLNVGAIEVSARIEDLFTSPRGGMRVYAEDAKTLDARFASVVFEVKMEDLRRSSARLQTRGELHEPFELDALADYSASDRGFVVTASKIDALYAGQAVTLVKPTRFEHDGDTTTLSKSTFSLADGRLTANGQYGVDHIEARLTLEQLSLAALAAMMPMADVTGTLSGHLQVSGSRSAPTGELELNMADVRSNHSTLAVAPPISGSLRGQWRGGRLQLNATLAEIANTTIDARASVPLRLDPVTLALTMPEDDAVDGTLRWAGELGPVWDLVSPYEDRFTGPGDLALELAGTMARPTASGHFQVIGGRYENVQSGTTLTGINLRLAGNGDKLTLEELTAGDGKRGTLVGGGSIDLLPAQSYPTNLHMDFSDILLVARDDLTLNASGKLALEGTLTSALLSGEIITGQSELSLAGTLPPDVVALDVDEVNIANDARARNRSPASAADSSVVILDLDISVPGRAFVRGLGLDSEWKGDVKISGNTNAPNVSGVLNPVRGHFSLMGKRFSLERGDIRFTGSDDVDPLLDLTAEHTAARLTALVRVTGSASKPKISLESRPPLPESEIASQVLFGTGSSNLSPGQSLQLASAIATYSGTGGAVGILDATRRAFGVDVISFAESEQDPDKTRVSVGKYVADGVYIEVERGAEESSRTSTTVEVEVLPDVRVEGGTTETGGSKVGIKWKWDY